MDSTTVGPIIMATVLTGVTTLSGEVHGIAPGAGVAITMVIIMVSGMDIIMVEDITSQDITGHAPSMDTGEATMADRPSRETEDHPTTTKSMLPTARHAATGPTLPAPAATL